MSELLPTTQAGDLRRGLSDYLATTFALTDGNAQSAIKDFLADPDQGLFKGAYVRLRLPFETAEPGWRDCLDWYEGFEPYGHQAKAFQRLSSKGSQAHTVAPSRPWLPPAQDPVRRKLFSTRSWTMCCAPNGTASQASRRSSSTP